MNETLDTREKRYGASLHELRDDRNLTQEEAAREIGISRKTLQLVEAGSVWPRPSTRRKIAKWREERNNV